MNRKIYKLVISGLIMTLAMPIMAQGTDEYLQPCDISVKVVAMGGGNIFEDPEGFNDQMKAVRNNPSTYDIKCWATKVEPSFEESYEIQCIYNRTLCARCWSPRGGNNAALVSIGNAIYDAIGHQDIKRIESKLEDIKNLTRKYASLLQDPYREYYLLRIEKKPQSWVTD